MKRAHLIDQLADLDDILASSIIERESLESIEPSELNQALRRVTLARVNSSLNNKSPCSFTSVY